MDGTGLHGAFASASGADTSHQSEKSQDIGSFLGPVSPLLPSGATLGEAFPFQQARDGGAWGFFINELWRVTTNKSSNGATTATTWLRR